MVIPGKGFGLASIRGLGIFIPGLVGIFIRGDFICGSSIIGSFFVSSSAPSFMKSRSGTGLYVGFFSLGSRGLIEL